MLPEENYLKQALELAQLAKKKNEVPVGALLVRNNKIIGKAMNTRETLFDPTGHAECEVIREVTKKEKNWRLSDCDLYVTLEPCVMCLAVCQQARIRKVYYGAKDSKGGAISLGYEINKDKKFNHRFEVEYVAMAECQEVITEFFKDKRNEKKSG